MIKWGIFYKKEIKDLWQSYKWLWVPLVFIVLGVMQPITTYYMPQIMDLAGIPKEAVQAMPNPTTVDVLKKILSQYSSIGVLILALASMQTVSGERTSGTAQLILVRPVSYLTFISAKWAALTTLTLVAFGLGYGSSCYYTNFLIGPVNWTPSLIASCYYVIWLIFIITVTIFFSSIFRAGGTIAFLSVGAVTLLSLLTSMLKKFMMWSPSRLVNQADHFLLSGKGAEHAFLSLSTTISVIFILIISAVFIFSRHDLSVDL